MNTSRGYRCDPEAGVVYGKLLKRPIRRVNRRGYVEVTSDGFVGLAHRMIWESVNGPIPLGMQINHINGEKTDNRIANLELATSSENLKHAYRIGLKTAVGERNGRAILTEPQVRTIRASEASERRLATEHGVSRSAIRDIKSGKNWRSVK